MKEIIVNSLLKDIKNVTQYPFRSVKVVDELLTIANISHDEWSRVQYEFCKAAKRGWDPLEKRFYDVKRIIGTDNNVVFEADPFYIEFTDDKIIIGGGIKNY